MHMQSDGMGWDGMGKAKKTKNKNKKGQVVARCCSLIYVVSWSSVVVQKLVP